MSEIPLIGIYDAITDKSIVREMTLEEVEDYNLLVEEMSGFEMQRLAKEEARISGMAKLMSLGLTEEEAKALTNGS